MNAEEQNSADRHPHIRNIVERVTEHHRRVRAEREESSFENAIDGAAFDLATDIAHPTAGPAEFGYDVDTDLGVDPR
ncbi:hypothetical protein AQI95_23045 [Streptomyces yokosukanensis]|uniref:Uncharacterized protein n=1 Tax=Streptomyces yokosukanensis TaxID=67386 RepID=A0A101P1U5_9ACTN|nr:hypothetical protein [Streptomyces yokosukanensis]KUN03385.1 hypothetical protein AQI95_23045 [Streptomyces yokosukanensis]